MEYFFVSLSFIITGFVFWLYRKQPTKSTEIDIFSEYKNRLSILEEEKIELIKNLQKKESQVAQLDNYHADKESESKILIEKLKQDLYNEENSRKTILSQKKSSEVRLGNIAEKLAPFLEHFPYNPEDAIFAGQPIDYIVFDDAAVVFVEIKSGKSQLSTKQRKIRDLIKSKCVEWKEIRIK